MGKDIYQRLSDAIDAQECIQYVSEAKVKLKEFNNYKDAIDILKKIPFKKEIWVDNIKDYLFSHQIIINWETNKLGFVEFSNQDKENLSKIIHKCDDFMIDSEGKSWVLTFHIYEAEKLND